jgi:diacylglycerol kinase family enzyme
LGSTPLSFVVATELLLKLGRRPTPAVTVIMRALLVHNPSAGTGEHAKSSITDALALADIKADYVSTKDTDLKRVLKKKYDLIVAAGGDGTIANVFRYLARRSTPIAILPLGSANNIARSLAIAGTPAELAEEWRAGHVKPFHLMEVAYDGKEVELCAEGFGVGVMAALIEQRAKEKKADGADNIRRGRRAASRLDSDVVAAKPDWQKVQLRCDPIPLHILVPVEHPAARKSVKGRRSSAARASPPSGSMR